VSVTVYCWFTAGNREDLLLYLCIINTDIWTATIERRQKKEKKNPNKPLDFPFLSHSVHFLPDLHHLTLSIFNRAFNVMTAGGSGLRVIVG